MDRVENHDVIQHGTYRQKIRPLFSVHAGIKFRTIFLLRAAKRFSAVLFLYVLDFNFQLYFSTFSCTALRYGSPYMHVSLSELSPYLQVSRYELCVSVRAGIPF